jgi:hypothetical protein
MSVCLLVMLMLAEQQSYDRFHTRKDRLYRILGDANHAKAPSAATPFPLAGALRTDYAGLDGVTQLTRAWAARRCTGAKRPGCAATSPIPPSCNSSTTRWPAATGAPPWPPPTP